MMAVPDYTEALRELLGIGLVVLGLVGGAVLGGLICWKKLTLKRHRPLLSALLFLMISLVGIGGSFAVTAVWMYRIVTVLFTIACLYVLFPWPRTGRL